MQPSPMGCHSMATVGRLVAPQVLACGGIVEKIKCG